MAVRTDLFNVKDLFNPDDRSIHSLIANGAPDGQIIGRIAKNVYLIDAQDPVYQLTPVALAAMAGNSSLVQILCKMGANPLPLDKRQWTPLHYTRVGGDEKTAQILREAAFSKKIALPNLGTLAQILNPVLPEPSTSIGHLMTLKGPADLDARTFQQLTDRIYSNQLAATPNSLAQYWRLSPTLPQSSQGDTVDGVISRMFNHPKFVSSEMEGALAFQESPWGRLSVVALKDIPAGHILGFHGGEIDPVPSRIGSHNTHRCGEVQSDHYSNLCAEIPDGLPKAFLQLVYKDGIPYRLVVSMDPIPEGKEICIDFGPEHREKQFPQKYLKETLDYFHTHSLKDLFASVKKSARLRTSFASELEQESANSKFYYLFHTPFLLMELLLDGKLDPLELFPIVSDASFSAPLSKRQHATVLSILTGWIDIKNHLDSLAPRTKRMIWKSIKSFIQAHSLPIVLQFFQQVTARLPKITTFESWNKELQVLQQNGLCHKTFLDWIDGKVSDDSLELILKYIHPLEREMSEQGASFLSEGSPSPREGDPQTFSDLWTNFEGYVRECFPEKLTAFRKILAQAMTSELTRCLGQAADPSSIYFKRWIHYMLSLSSDEIHEIYLEKRKHVSHRYPKELNYFDSVFQQIKDKRALIDKEEKKELITNSKESL